MTEIFRYAHHLDKDITLAINSLHCPASDFVWQVFSDKEIWFVMYGIVAFFIFRNLGWKRGLIAFIGIVLTIVCCDQTANFTKEFFGRLRPCWDGEMIDRGLVILEDKANLYGFYSAHAANALGFAISSSLAFRLNDKQRSYKAYTLAIIIWGILVGVSRIFVGKHFFGDVLTGFVVGTVYACIFSIIAARIADRVK